MSICHKGIIDDISDTSYFVRIERSAACQGCGAKKYCNLSENTDEVIPVARLPHQNFKINDKVTVVLKEMLGWKALFHGYILPFIILMAGILITVACGVSQGFSGLIGIGSTVLYYCILAIFRKKIDKKFVFSIE